MRRESKRRIEGTLSWRIAFMEFVVTRPSTVCAPGGRDMEKFALQGGQRAVLRAGDLPCVARHPRKYRPFSRANCTTPSTKRAKRISKSELCGSPARNRMSNQMVNTKRKK